MLVSLENITKTFYDRRATQPALASVNLTVASGEFIGIIGPSGCGKSTLLRLIADQIQPSTGFIRLNNQSPHTRRQNKEIAWMAQNPALLPWKTVMANVAIPRMVNRRHTLPAPDPAELLEMVGLTPYAQVYPGTLSGGMQQRVALARTLATGAPLWLMDEPFAALDELMREIMTREVLRLWQRYHPTVLWVTHHIVEAVRLSDRVVVLSASPGAIRSVVPINLPRPRDDTSESVVSYVRKLRAMLQL